MTLAPHAIRRVPLWAGLVLVLAGLAAYAGSFRAAFVLDDKPAIVDNPTIRHFVTALRPPHDGTTVDGRPLLNLSLALNYALGGTNVGGYHALNLGLHLMAGLALFGLVRRTLARIATGPAPGVAPPAVFARMGDFDRSMVALGAALLWVLHPLQTESVTYVVQRAESMMGLFYLLTLYCFLRGAEAASGPGSGRWFALSWGACLCGMATKEVMVSAPVIVLLYDRTFLSGSIRAAWARRKGVYLALGSTWILLASLVAGTAGRSGTAGFQTGVSWVDYLRTQAFAVPHYLRLVLWPRPLVFDYGTAVVTAASAVVPGALVLLGLAGATALAWRRWPGLGFAGAWFFALLAPTCLVPVATQTMAEHRMYLALAAPLAVAAGAMARLPGPARLVIFGVLAVGLGVATFRRNRVYRSEAALWADNVAKRPDDARGHNNLGKSYFEQGNFAAAVAEYREALRLDPNLPYVYINLGSVWERMGQLPAAIAIEREAVQRRPDWAGVRKSLADALNHAGNLPEAMAQYREALRLKPDYAQAENGLGTVLARAGRTAEAMAHVQAALAMDPNYAEADNTLGTLFAGANRLPEAIACYERALALNPDYAEAHLNLGNACFEVGRLSRAIQEYDRAIGLQPEPAEVHEHLGILCAETGQFARAEAQFEEALRLQPGYREAEENLRRVRAVRSRDSGRSDPGALRPARLRPATGTGGFTSADPWFGGAFAG